MRQLIALFLVFLLSLSACGGGGGDDDGSSGDAAVGSPESKVIVGTDIQYSEIGGDPITQGTTTVAISDVRVEMVDGGQALMVDVAVTNGGAEVLRFPEFMFVCNLYFGNRDLGLVSAGSSPGIQPGEEFVSTLTMPVPAIASRSVDPACMDDAYIDVRFDATLSTGYNLTDEALLTGIYRLDAATIAELN